MAHERPMLDQINIVAADMDATVAFYRRLGVEIPDRSPEWDPHHREAKMEGGLHFDIESIDHTRQWDQGWPGADGEAGVVIGFRVDEREDVDRVYAEITGAGYRGQQPPYNAFWGARYAVVEDPDGHPVGLMSPSDPARRTPPAPPSDWK
jgi:catechol 2,3-dioxygenase-like lactoylglutathione lyase family enzyme